MEKNATVLACPILNIINKVNDYTRLTCLTNSEFMSEY